MSLGLTETLLAMARQSGAATAGIATVQSFEDEYAQLVKSAASGLSGTLHFTYDNPRVATRLTDSFPWARTLVVVGWNYFHDSLTSSTHGPQVARFASSDHYARLRAITERLSSYLRAQGFQAETLIDDNRLVDRGAAVRAGVGWRGKSTMVLTPGHGPWMLLGSVATDAPLEPSTPMRRNCGTCTACIPACPTGALGEAGLDARRCLSAWLQARGSIPHWIRHHLGTRIYGCDDCLTVCPPGLSTMDGAATPRSGLTFAHLLSLRDSALLDRFHWWYVPMRDARYLRRNLLIAAGNAGDTRIQPLIEAHLSHGSSMIRGVAAWAFARSVGMDSIPMIDHRLGIETTPEVRDELMLARLMSSDTEAYSDLLTADEWVTADVRAHGLALIPNEASDSAPQLRAIVQTITDLTVPHLMKLDLALGLPETRKARQNLASLIRVNDPERRFEAIRRKARMSDARRAGAGWSLRPRRRR